MVAKARKNGGGVQHMVCGVQSHHVLCICALFLCEFQSRSWPYESLLATTNAPNKTSNFLVRTDFHDSALCANPIWTCPIL